MKHETNKYTLAMSEERKTQKIDASSNNDRAGAWKFCIKKCSKNIL